MQQDTASDLALIGPGFIMFHQWPKIAWPLRRCGCCGHHDRRSSSSGATQAAGQPDSGCGPSESHKSDGGQCGQSGGAGVRAGYWVSPLEEGYHDIPWQHMNNYERMQNHVITCSKL